MSPDNSNSPHILNSSATLMGLCFVVLTSLRVNDFREASMIDELTAIAIMLFMASCLFSFLSIRSRTKRGFFYEKIADYVFLTGLILLFSMTILIAFNTIQ